MAANPLIAAREDTTDWSTGISLVSSVTDADGVTTDYTHHSCGAPTSITISTGATTSIDVDAAGPPIRIVEPEPI
ncbi:hypothetical protein [Nocardia salmonicida]|uniref:hypothetical protein n=1 Tax=Nocardia salmonicida TaxID=53431 RepID=UPI003792A5F6